MLLKFFCKFNHNRGPNGDTLKLVSLYSEQLQNTNGLFRGCCGQGSKREIPLNPIEKGSDCLLKPPNSYNLWLQGGLLPD